MGMAKLLLLFYILKFSLQTWDMQVVQKITTDVSSEISAGCVTVLYPPNGRPDQKNLLQQLLIKLAKIFENDKIPQTTMGYSFNKYNMKYHDKKSVQQTFDPCTKWMTVMLATTEAKDYLNLLSQEFIFSKPTWLIFMNSSNLEDFFSRVHLRIDSRVWVVHAALQKSDRKYNNSEKEYKLTEVQKFKGCTGLKTIQIGTWSARHRLSLIEDRSMTGHRHDFGGHDLRVGAHEAWPMVSFIHGDAGKDRTVDGYLPKIWFQLEALLNVKSKIIRAVDNTPGSKLSDGNWSGVIGMVIRNEVDIVLAEMDYAGERMSAADYLLPILSAEYQIFYREDDSIIDLTAIFRPFDKLTWLTFLATILLSSSVYYAINYIEVRKIPGRDHKMRWIECLFLVLQAVSFQGSHNVPKVWAARIVFLTCYLMSTVLFPCYSASLISSLTQRKPLKPFEDISGVWNSQYRLIIPANSSFYEYFETHKSQHMRDLLYHRAVNVSVSNVSDYSSSIKYLCSNTNVKMALFTANGLAMDYVRKDPSFCPLRPMERSVSKTHSSLVLAKHSQYSQACNYYLLKMMEAGLIVRTKNQYRRFQEPKEKEFTLAMVDVAEVFMLLGVSIVVAVLIMCLERFFLKI